jgi:hypothetical protein
MVIYSSMCPGVESQVQEALMGWNPFIMALRKNQELAKGAVALGYKFSVKLAKAIIEVSQPEAMQC